MHAKSSLAMSANPVLPPFFVAVAFLGCLGRQFLAKLSKLLRKRPAILDLEAIRSSEKFQKARKRAFADRCDCH